MNDRIKFLKGRIYQVLFEHGPKTYAELLPYLPGLTVANVQRCTNHDKRQYAPERNTFRIVGYHRNLGKKGDMSPIIGLGPGPDVPKPEINAGKEQSRRAVQQATVKRHTPPEQVAVELAKLHYRHMQEANGGDRSALVFASMFAQPPAPPIQVPRRVYKTRGG